MKFAVIISVIIIVISAGCATPRIGSPIETSKVQQIRSGYTTRDDILNLFGTPLRNVPGETGEIWVYRYLDGEGGGQELVISFTGDKVSVFSYR